jgi:hypothetical protein
MPIRINLKELFSADSQSIVIDKINFNFNKLLELGVGEPGEKGFSGIQGAAGPIGLTGDQGIRGATWFVDSATNPNTLTFVDLLEDDLYLDSNNLAIWQYNGTQWNFVVDITNVINNYLVASPSPFKRGFGIGTPNDDRFILFNKRDDLNDISLGINASPSQNDILFLNNYDEDAIIPFANGPAETPTGSQVDTNAYYNSLLAISVDHRSLSTGRYHLELGSLYDTVNPKLTSTYENLKIKFRREGGSVHGGTHYNKAIFSLDIPELSLDSLRITNGVFDFVLPKFLGAENSRFNIYLGSKYGLDEVASGGSGFVNSDGILFYSGSAFGNVGLIDGHLIPSYPNNTGYVANSLTSSYLWLESLAANGIMLNDIVLQNGGNIVQLGTTPPRLKATVTSQKGAPGTTAFLYSGAITILGNEVYTGFGNSDIYNFTNADLLKSGYFNKFSISDPNSPTSDFIITSVDYIEFDGSITRPTVGNDCNQQYTSSENPIGPGLKDMVSDGDYIYAVNSQRLDKNPTTTTSGGSTYAHTAFQILKKNSKNSIGLTRVSRLGLGSTNGGSILATEINGASRIKLFGKYAIIATNTLQGWNTPLNISDTALNTYDGRITAIDVSDPLNPRIEATAGPYKTLTAPSTTAILDLDIIDDYAFVLTWEQTNGTTTADVQVRFDVFDLRGLKRDDPSTNGTVQWIGRGQIPILDSTGLNAGQISALSKTGAISTDGRYVYVGYDNTVYKYSFNTLNGGRNGVFTSFCYSQYPSEDQSPVAGVSSRKIVDIKILGNSLYVLLSDASNGQFVKFETKDVLTQVYSRSLSGQAVSRFENSGKHFYIACQNTNGSGETNANSLIAIDFDGFYTAGAHIESLRADEVNISKDLKVGGSLNIATSLNVGSGAQIQGHLGVEKAIQTPYLINDEGNLNIVAGGSGRDVNITASDNIVLNPTGDLSVNASNAEMNLSNRFDLYCPNSGAPQSQISADLGNIYVYSGLEMQLQSDGAAPANYNTPANFPLKIFGHLSASGAHTTQISTITPTQPAIISGTFNPPANVIPNDTSGASIMHWQKIGNIISVTGRIAFDSDNSSILLNGLVPFPLKHTLHSISNVYGTATISTNAGSTMNLEEMQCTALLPQLCKQ